MSIRSAAQWGFLAQPGHTDVPVDPAVIGSAPWRDNAYVTFWDPGQELFGTVHVSTSPNAAGRRARCSGLRDRTWGPRDESAAWPEYVGVVACLPEFNVTLMKFRGVDGTARAHGFLLYPDHAEPVLRMSFTREAAGLINGAGLTTEDGLELTLRMRSARSGFWVPMGAGGPPPTMSAYDDALDVWLDGRAESSIGAGFSEQGVIRYL